MSIIGTSGKEDVVVLAGHEFKRVKNGLDEGQVAALIDELIRERDKLAESQNHITALSRLAERTVVEAEKLASQMKAEAVEQAKAEGAAIIDKAREEARQLSEKKMAETIQAANEQAKAIRARAEQEAAALLDNEKKRIRSELRSLVDQQISHLLEELEHVKQQVMAMQVEFGNELPAATQEKVIAPAPAVERTVVSDGATGRQSSTIVAEETGKAQGTPPEPAAALDKARKDFEFSGLLQPERQPEATKPQWEVEILPPFEIRKIMDVVAFLDKLPEVASTEMIVPQIDVPLILVFLRKPVNMVDILKTIPVVAYVEEVPFDKATSDGRPRKVRIGFSGHKKS